MACDRTDGPPFGHRAMPERTPVRAWQCHPTSTNVGWMIDQTDEAVERWLAAMLGVQHVEFVTGGEEPAAPAAGDQRIEVTLVGVAERSERRDTDVSDVRDDDGRVTARQRSLRFFDVDYRVSVTGEARAAHAMLGRLLQALVDVDTIEPDYLPDALRALDVPIELTLAPDSASTQRGSSARSGVGLELRVLLPVRPSADDEIAPPATSLHLDVSPPPERDRTGAPRGDDDTTTRFVGERSWTTVRRREAISPRSS